MNKKMRTIVLKHSRYQPSKKELEETIRLKIPGKDVHEKARNLAREVLQTVKVRQEE